jgi:hypothetical protein
VREAACRVPPNGRSLLRSTAMRRKRLKKPLAISVALR